MKQSLLQFNAILWRAILCNFREKDFIRELISVFILGAFIVFVERFTPNNFISPFYMAVSVLGYCRYVALSWVTQKQTRQKQLQKIMGMSQAIYTISWLVYYLLNAFMITFVMMIILLVGVFAGPETNIAYGYTSLNIFFIYFLFTVSIIGLVMVLSTFFSKAKMAAQVVTFVQLLSSMIFFLRFSQDYSNNKIYIWLSCLIPQQGFNLGVTAIAFMDGTFPPTEFSYEQSCIGLFISGLFYLILALYLDQIMPNQIGTNKHPLFFIRWIWRKNNNQSLEENRQSLLDENGVETSAKYEQVVNRKIDPVVKIKHLIKSFSEKTAVDDVTINFYDSEIFCLLGHNGAGKSTMINLLTGMLTPTNGDIQLMGMNYQDSLDDIRRNIGLCLQYNVLYDSLTIEEHLLFYSYIKGISKAQAQIDIDNIINKCALNNERGKFAKNLSGGNKRKLCMACALIGNSKLIFLDEPSSGLDPNSRQAIWDIMKQIKTENRCIILTTHHLEQAEALAQRIGIMSDGKLIIVGDNDFIKEKFNVGYHMTMTLPKENQQIHRQAIKNIVYKHIKDAKEDEQTALNNIKFILPIAAIDRYSALFEELENGNFGQLSIKMSNLEDAFIKLGTEESAGEGVVPDIPDMQIPNLQCSFNFFKQYKAVWIRKALMTLRSVSVLFSVALPTLFMILGVIVASIAIPQKDGEQESETLKYLKRFIMSYFMVWAFVFNTASYCGSIVYDRQKRSKYISNVMGLRQFPYWFGNYTFDWIIFAIPLFVFLILIFVIPQASFLRDIVFYLGVTLILFSFSFIGYSYVFSFMFQKSNTAYRTFPVFNFIFFYILPSIPQYIDKQNSFSQYGSPLISPFIAFSNCFFSKQFVGEVGKNFFTINSLYYHWGCLAVQAVVYFGLTLFMESIRFKLNDKEKLDNYELQAIVDDNELNAMAVQVNNRQSINDGIEKPIQIRNLYKKYPNGYVAIQDNSFVVDNQEIFGLLGPNGAGKSTTFNISTAALPKTAGRVKILGQEVNKGLMSIFQNVGICPQYDPIFQTMTVQQHLQYFGRVKGLNEDQINQALQFYYEVLSLRNYALVRAGNLSGGNKRKLCVSMAMMANPRILFFDEPSAGVDPISRRYLWKALSLAVKNFNTSMVLTTHSMNQAESLCSKIGILIKGRFVALDTPKNLTMQYGKGFRVYTYSNIENHEKLKQLVINFYGKNIQIEKIPDKPQGILFIIPTTNFLLSKAYKFFHDELYKSGLLNKYQITQSTLQQVFIHLSRMQPEQIEMSYPQPWQCFCCQWGATGWNCLV